MTDAWIERLIEIKNHCLLVSEQKGIDSEPTRMWIIHLLGYIESLEEMKGDK